MVSAEQNVGGIGLLWSNMVGGYLSLYMFAKFISSHEVWWFAVLSNETQSEHMMYNIV